MKVEFEEISPVKKSLTIEADLDEVRRETEQVVRRYAARVKVPGFRAGKVPLDIVRARFAQEVEEDVRERLVASLFQKATDERGLKPLAAPQLETVTGGGAEPLRFKTVFEVAPSFTVGDYRGIEVRESVAGVSDEEVSRALEEIRESQARLVYEEGRKAATGDFLVADVEAEPEGAEPFRRERTLLEVGAQGNLPEFNERLVGAASGDALAFEVRYPAEFPSERVAGKVVRYRLMVHEVKRREVPALDDEFARSLGEFESLDALRARVSSDLEERSRLRARGALRESLLDKVLLVNPIPLPDVLVDDEVHHRLEDMVRGMMLQGIDPEKIKVDWQQIRSRQTDPARKSVHARLVLDAIAEAEGIGATPEEVEGRIRQESERLGESPETLRARLRKHDGMEALRNQMVREKTLDFLVSVANIQREVPECR